MKDVAILRLIRPPFGRVAFRWPGSFRLKSRLFRGDNCPLLHPHAAEELGRLWPFLFGLAMSRRIFCHAWSREQDVFTAVVARIGPSQLVHLAAQKFSAQTFCHALPMSGIFESLLARLAVGDSALSSSPWRYGGRSLGLDPVLLTIGLSHFRIRSDTYAVSFESSKELVGLTSDDMSLTALSPSFNTRPCQQH